MTIFPSAFVWGASTAPHQIADNNVNSDWWAREGMPGMERSGDAVDTYHRYARTCACWRKLELIPLRNRVGPD